jgi:hypothetical protein
LRPLGPELGQVKCIHLPLQYITLPLSVC